jgi:hypothetical protein
MIEKRFGAAVERHSSHSDRNHFRAGGTMRRFHLFVAAVLSRADNQPGAKGTPANVKAI